MRDKPFLSFPNEWPKVKEGSYKLPNTSPALYGNLPRHSHEITVPATRVPVIPDLDNLRGLRREKNPAGEHISWMTTGMGSG